MRLLLVEDDATLGKLIQYKLSQSENWQVDWAKDGEEGEWMAKEGVYDIILLDWRLPEKSGLDLLKAIRAAGVHTPVLFLTARDAVDDRVLGLESGADDYLVKPFEFAELKARIRALMRRPPNWGHDAWIFADLRVHPKSGDIFWKDQPLHFTGREKDLFMVLLRQQGQTVSREQLIHAVWRYGDVTDNILDQYMVRLRRKIEHTDLIIENIRGQGYRLLLP
ncbi:MAG: response regulator transcription factor [Candidatus Carbobacillus altaicus]|nr:response regulator transcription factor [Candidatus Carbobacillus altaicus]